MYSDSLPQPSLPSGRRRLGPPVPVDFAGERLDGYLAKHFPFLSRSGWQARIEREELLVNGMRRKSASRLKEGDEITLFAPDRPEPPVDDRISIIWQGDGVLALFKPGNLPMHENGPYRKNTFTEIVWQRYGREWSAVHRLDRETSGIVLCAATSDLRGRLAADFANRVVKKQYLAIVRGVPEAQKWRCDGPIGDLEGSQIRIKKWVVPGGLPAATGFDVLDIGRDSALLRATPVTGRTNQIRIHSAYTGHVLYGDKLFHPDESVFIEYFEQGQTDRVTKETGFPRLCLHAERLSFTHPANRKVIDLESPLPLDLADFWQTLKC